MNPRRQSGAVSLNCSDPGVDDFTFGTNWHNSSQALPVTQLDAAGQNKTLPLLGTEHVWEFGNWFKRTGPAGAHFPSVPCDIKSGNSGFSCVNTF